ncbi:Uncharacterized BCR, YaiI/YqxD family COG1671 [Leclercia adecarboxylata]|uniref:UPF0178 protein NCTC13032_01473 n=1 Tax=Leclercia adecarboxylata TaxID=83655 RepID=A0A4V6JHK1_9ENTR|nr:Uncharacterized BCR, YaiI/YqxD family COG1671 [Leclercia adecarboxylata]
MAIWVDADACPNVIKEILFRAAERVQMPMTLVANQNLRVPPSRFIRTLRVPAGFDVADNEIVRQCSAGDLVITADIPLAAEVLEKGAAALNPRGERYSPATIREKADDARFHGYPARQWRPDRRAGQFVSARQTALCRRTR